MTQSSRIKVRGLKAAARNRWVEIFESLAPESSAAIERLGRHVPCPVHGGKDGYRVFKNFNETGGGICNTCGGHSDGIDHLMWLKDWSFPQTLEAVANVIDYDTQGRAQRPPINRKTARSKPSNEQTDDQAKVDERLKRSLETTWKESIPLDDPEAEPARLYLARRGLGLEFALQSKVLRFHPALGYFQRRSDKDGTEHLGDYPAIIALMFDSAGKPCTLHRTYITYEGYKAPVQSPKKLAPYPSYRSVSGGAIPLVDATCGVIAFTEGIETALAVIEATDGALPVWPVVSATLLKQVVPPADTEVVCFYGDQDRNGTGRSAVLEAKGRLWKSGMKVMGFIPKSTIPDDAKGIDWLDIFNQEGADKVPFPESLEKRIQRMS